MNRAWVAGATCLSIALFTGGLVPAAFAADPSTSRAGAQFLDASLLGLDLSGIVGIDGASATYVDGTTPGGSVVDNAALDVTALGALTLPVPNNIQLGDLLQLGVVSQQARALPDGVSDSSTSTADASLDLTALLGSTPLLSSATLDLGAVGSSASIDGSDPTTLTRDYNIADVLLQLQSPAVGAATTQVNGAVTTLSNTLNGLAAQIDSLVTTALTTAVAPIDALPGTTATVNPQVTINADLTTLLAPVLSQTVGTGDGVSINLATGQVTIDLEQIIDLNDLPPNSTLLSPEVLQNISGQISDLMDGVQAQINTILTNALDSVTITISGGASVSGPLGTSASVGMSYNGSLQDLLDGSSLVGVTATSSIPGSSLLLGPILTGLGPAIAVALAPVLPVAQTAVSTAGTAVNAAVTGLTNALDGALDMLTSVAAVNLNVQNGGDGINDAATVTAVQVQVLSGVFSGVELNLATSSVGPNLYSVVNPTLDAQNTPVPAGTDAAVDGSGWIDDSTVTLQLTDGGGNPIGAPVTVTVDGSGNFPAGTTVPVPAGTDPGTYTVVATDTAGNRRTDTITVPDTTPPPVAITSPADGAVIGDDTPTITGTTEPGSAVHVVVSDPGTGATVFEGDATVAPDGTWSITSTRLPDGPYTVTATATDAAGNTASATADFMVDTAAPDVAITSPTAGEVTNDPTPTVTGTTEPGATVDVVITDAGGNVVFEGPAAVDGDGDWTVTPGTDLPDGLLTITATATDPAGNEATDTVTFRVDTAPPPVDVVNPTDGLATNDTTPTVTGTSEPGATVDVVITDTSGTVVFSGPATVDASGNWTVDSTALPEGDYTVTATATDTAGNTATDSNTFTVDTTAPDITITSPTPGEATTDTTPTITGTSEPGATVHVTITDPSGDVVFEGDATVDAATGDWTIDSTALPDGDYVVTAVATDAAGNQSAGYSVAFTVDTTAPVVDITSPADGSSTNDPTPTITGTVDEPDATVHVVVTDATDTVVFEGDATVDLYGVWTIDSTTLPEGDYTVTATATDPAGNASAPVSSTFTVDLTPPAVAITSPADGTAINDPTPTIVGTSEPDVATVHVVLTNDAGVVVFEGDATVDTATGDWTIDAPALPDDTYTIAATATDQAGNTSEPVTSDFILDTVAAPPVITSPADGSTTNDTTPTIIGTAEPDAEVTVRIDGVLVGTVTADDAGNWSLDLLTPLAPGGHTVSATQTDVAGNTSQPTSNDFTIDIAVPAAPVITSPTQGELTNDATPAITGTGEPGATVTLRIDGNPVDTSATPIVVGADGTWSYTVPDASPLADGPHTVSATQTDVAGNTSPTSPTVTFTVDTTVAPPAVTGPADGSTIGDSTPTITGTGEPGATVTVVIDGQPVGTAVVGDTGTWTFPTTQPLSDGAHTVTATQVDEAGNPSGPSQPVTFTVDTTVDAPAITSPDSGTVTNDDTPTISGTAGTDGLPGDTITVYVDGQPIGTTTVLPGGTWTFTPPTGLDDGNHTITATETDQDGNTSPLSDSVVITVDTVANPPVITSPAAGSTTNDTTPTITGTAEPGATVEVRIDNNGVVPTTADATGSWSLNTTTPLVPGPHAVTATQTDVAGNVSQPTTQPFIVDLLPPPAPVITSPAQGSSTTDTTPAITGTGEQGATVTVTVDGAVVGSGTVTPLGTWEVTPTTPLAPGGHIVSATQTDAAGNTSPAAAGVSFTVTAPSPASATGGCDTAARTLTRCPAGDASVDQAADTAADTGGTGGFLADTGAAAGLGLLVLVGLGAVVSGLWLVRRRRHDTV